MQHPAGLPDHLAQLTRTLVFGVLNVTPDSFSDGGQHASKQAAIQHGLSLAADGADIVDVGGESTRPGADRVTTDEELTRVIPVVQGLVEAGVVVSVDTMRAAVATQAIAAGAQLINDVSGGQADGSMLAAIADANVPFVMMHWRGHSDRMAQLTQYLDVTSDVCAELQAQLESAVSAGVASQRIVLDPGIGFAKTPDQNWPLLAQIAKLQELGHPILVGASRKRFIGELLADENGPRAVDLRESATTAITTIMAQHQVWAVRVHDVSAARDAIAVVEKLRGSSV
jgi:dihydropteroate synthase